MIIKVSGIKNLEEATVLAKSGADILCFTILLEEDQTYRDNFFEPRFLDLEEVVFITESIDGPKFSVYFEFMKGNYQEEHKKVNEAIQRCQLDYVEWDSRFDSVAVPVIDHLGISHDDRISRFWDTRDGLRPGIPQLSFNGLLCDWNWLKTEADQYPEVIKLSDIHLLVNLHPDIIMDYPIKEQNYREVLDSIPANSWNLTLGAKQDDHNNYSIEEVTCLINLIKKYRC